MSIENLPEKLSELKEQLEKSLNLLNDPQPGISSWWLMLAERLEKLKVLL